MKQLPGFSIFEAVLCIAIIGIGVVGILYAVPTFINSSLLADQTIVATNIARETMEKIIAQRDCNQASCGYTPTLTSINTTGTYNANPVAGFTGYVLTSTALEVNADNDDETDDFLDAQSGSGYARVTVQVSWNAGTKSIKLVTLITNYT